MSSSIEIPSWDDYFMTLVYMVASRSKDWRTHMGAVIVDQNHFIVSTGYNSFPRHIDDKKAERQEKNEKKYWILHAEENAILNSGRLTLEGCTLYTNAIPCSDKCAIQIVQKRPKEVVVDKKWPTNTAEWTERNKRTLEMFAEAEIGFRQLDTNYIQVVRFNDGIVLPLK
ncbi:MAG: deaminase [Candidatus Pacearchaeota archaeon]|jgi:dCMP deaminase